MPRWLSYSNDMSSLSSAGNPRFPMRFTEKWREGRVFDWYKALQKSSVLVNRLQVRIDHGRPAHRFVLAYLKDGVVCRFDRRPKDADPSKLMLETFGAKPRKAADEYHTLHEGDADLVLIQRSTICEIDIEMPPNTDLLLILSACFALSRDPVACDYDLLSYNCYFFAWTITTVVVRHTLPFRIPAPTDIAQGLAPGLTKLSHSITEKVVKALPGMVIGVAAAARQVAGDEIRKGSVSYGRLVWRLPMSVMNFSLRQILKIQMYLGLEDTIRKRCHERILDVCTTLLQDVLNQENITSRVEKRLWINELKEDIRAGLRERLTVTVWDTLLDVLAAVNENIDGQKASADNEHNPNRRLSLKRYLTHDSQFTQVWNEGLSAGLPAARDAIRGKAEKAGSTSTQLHNEIFDIAFTAGGSAVQAAAKNVVDRTQPALNNPKQAKMWETVWSVWDDLWMAAHENARTTVVSIFEEAVEEIVALVTDQVVESVRGNQGQEVQAWVQYTKESRTILSAGDFQERINQFVRSAHPAAGQYAENIQATMAKVWDTASAALQSDHQDIK